jgi:asparagine synthase (glutamine-hydrolysing)
MVKYFSETVQGFNTFSIGFKGWDKSEHQFAQIIADKFKTTHYNAILDSTSLNILPELMYFYDEPIADISIIPTYFVSKLAAVHNKAVLSGEGADELFAGYDWHRDYLWPVSKKQIRDSKKYGWDLPENHFNVESYSRAMSMGLFDKTHLELLLNNDLHKFIPDDVTWFYKQYFNEQISVPKRFQILDLKTFMGELVLTKIDRAGMANSLEVRVPFLSKNVSEFLLSLDPSMYFDAKKQKIIIFKILKKSKVPRNILYRPKQGFTGPDTYYHNIDFYKKHLLNGELLNKKIINIKYLQILFEQKEYWRLWKLIVFELWHQKWVKSD